MAKNIAANVKYLKGLLQSSGKSLCAIADEMGVSKGTLNSSITRAVFSRELAEKFATVLRVNPDQLKHHIQLTRGYRKKRGDTIIEDLEVMPLLKALVDGGVESMTMSLLMQVCQLWRSWGSKPFTPELAKHLVEHLQMPKS